MMNLSAPLTRSPVIDTDVDAYAAMSEYTAALEEKVVDLELTA